MEILRDLKLYHHNNETSILKICYGCCEVIELHSWYYIGKDNFNCDWMLHKFCGEMPMEMSHPFHPQPHLLKLKRNYGSNSRLCDFCGRENVNRSFMYSCMPCNIDVDIMCAGDATLRLLSSKSLEERKRMILKDISHHHQLHLMHIQTRQDDDYDDDDDDNVDDEVAIRQCKACLQPIIDSTFYICTQKSEGCNDYSLHKFCAELPVEMKHELHPLHPLTLMLSPPPGHFKCFACGKLCEGPIYSCRACSFQLHIICATTRSRVLEHKCHQHPLTLLPMSSSSIFCSACCKVHEGMFYQCNTCVVFYIHQDCASLSYTINHRSHEGHPLRLGYNSDGTRERIQCDICYKPISIGTGWYYYCWECKFYSHLNCIKADIDQEVQEIDQETPCLPWEESDNEFGTVGLLRRYLGSTQTDEGNEMNMINHFSHPKHPLILQSDIPREVNPYSDGKIMLATQCNGCCKQISAPLYSCSGCNFYIHKGCALLPNSVAQHHGHSEHDKCRLVLLRESWCETRLFKCSFCEEYCNGFSYQCEEDSCNYQIDVECAFLPSKIVHKAHPCHPLHMVKLKQELSGWQHTRLKCCSEGRGLLDVFRYATCFFMIHTKCAMYPGKAHHRFDCDNPFTLCYNPGQIEQNEYHYCDMCEQILNPKLWFYFSSKMGGLVMHPHCILLGCQGSAENPNFKSISSLFVVDYHPHPLNRYPISVFSLSSTSIFARSTCNHCKSHIFCHPNSKDVQQPSHFAYECVEWDCQYRIHVRCPEYAYGRDRLHAIRRNKIILQTEEDAGISTIGSSNQQLYLEGNCSGLGGKPDNVATSEGEEILEPLVQASQTDVGSY